MLRKTVVLSLAFVALLSCATQSDAVTTIKVQPVVRNLLQGDLTPLPASAITLNAPGRVRVVEGTGPIVLDVAYYMSIAELRGPQLEVGFGNVVFDILPTNLAIDPVKNRWRPDTSFVDINGDEPEGLEPMWADNADYGPSGNDLKSIIVGLAPAGFGAEGVDPRRTIGQAEPVLMGSTILDWDPVASPLAGFQSVVGAFSTYTTSLRLRELRGGLKLGGSVLLEVGPGQDGDTDADGDVDIVDLNNVRNHFSESGENVLGDTAPYDGVVDIEDLNRVQNNFGFSVLPGAMAAVPEPASGALAVLGVVALASCARRRRR